MANLEEKGVQENSAGLSGSEDLVSGTTGARAASGNVPEGKVKRKLPVSRGVIPKGFIGEHSKRTRLLEEPVEQSL